MQTRALILFSLCILSINAYSQRENINLLPPQTYDFVKYGNTPVSYFTGEVDIKVPIYTYSDKDFEIPIFAGYNSSGFVPTKRDGIVGTNWFLKCGRSYYKKGERYA